MTEENPKDATAAAEEAASRQDESALTGEARNAEDQVAEALGANAIATETKLPNGEEEASTVSGVADEAKKADDAEENGSAAQGSTTDGSQQAEKPKAKEPLAHGTKVRIAIAAACVLVVAACAIATVVTTNFADYKKAVDSYQRSAAALQERNEALDQAVASLQFLVNSGAQPLEIQLVTRAQELIDEAKAAKNAVPPMPSTAEEIRVTTNKIRISGNYAQLIKQLNDAEDALEDSIALRELVVDPTASNVIERLRTVPHIIAAEAVTPENDPNGLLNQPEGYSAMVYFSYSLIIQDKVYGEGVVGKGTSGGGSVEVYPTVEQAEARNDYISQFDGTDLAPGYHEVVGSIVVRISDRLTPERQQKLAAEVVEALTTLPEDEKK